LNQAPRFVACLY